VADAVILIGGAKVLGTVLNKVAGLGGASGEVTEGIYEFAEGDGTYVGQSGNISNRLGQHVSNGRVSPEGAAAAERTNVTGGKLSREIAEQRRINELGGVKGGRVTNKVNPIGPNRQHLMDGSD
jgi:hypothetical protein